MDNDPIAAWLMRSLCSLLGHAALLDIVVVTVLVDADMHF